jgi:hypothetical protein
MNDSASWWQITMLLTITVGNMNVCDATFQLRDIFRRRMPLALDEAAIPYPTIDGVDSTYFLYFIRHGVQAANIGKVTLPEIDIERRINPIVEISYHPTLVAVRMIQREMAPLPIKMIIHMKDVHVPEIDSFAIYPVDKDRILSSGSARKDPARRSLTGIVALDFFCTTRITALNFCIPTLNPPRRVLIPKVWASRSRPHDRVLPAMGTHLPSENVQSPSRRGRGPAPHRAPAPSESQSSRS